ncbi:MAG: hypothetical protein GX602_04770, partial [Dehalococcoidales bacterium]|nr:hypothetical protein [Dehalococcoidales bacterium]
EARKEGKTFSQFVKPYFIKNTKKLHEHQKVRKEFSLPILTKQGKAIISKSGWDGTSTYQMINNPSGDRENQMEAPVITPEGKIESSLMSWAKSTRIVKLSKTETPNGKLADPEAWYPIEISLPKEFEKLWVNIADNTRPFIAIKFACKGSDISSSKFTFKELRPRDYPGEITNELTKKAQEIVDTHMEKVKLIEAGAIFTYKGSSFSTDEAFRKALAFAIPVKKPK